MDDPSVSITHPKIRPCIAELLRTGHHPPELFLRVERVIEVPVIFTESLIEDEEIPFSTASLWATQGVNEEHKAPKRKTYRLFLCDGELIIQALLKRELHFFVSLGEVVTGAILSLEAFEVRKARRISRSSKTGKATVKDSDHVVFLAVERFRTIAGAMGKQGYEGIEKGTPIVKETKIYRKRTRDVQPTRDLPAPQNIKRIKTGNNEAESVDEIEEVSTTPPDIHRDSISDCDKEDISGDPDLLVSELLLEETAERLRSSSPCERPSSSGPKVVTDTSSMRTKSPVKPSIFQPFLTRPVPTDRQLNLLSLYTLFNPPHPLPKRNYVVDLFGVISWVSPSVIERRNMPLKRDLRVIDPSFTSHPHQARHPTNDKLKLGISVSVFVDADQFCPSAGTVALLRGLKTHEWEGISLNAYEKDCGNGKKWFICDQKQLETQGLDVAAMKEWWEGRKTERVSLDQTEEKI